MTTRITFRNGKICGADRKDNTVLWENHAKKYKTGNFNDIYNLYNLQQLHTIYKWVLRIRAGIILLHQSTVTEMLFVHHRETTCKIGNQRKTVPKRRGPPKGAAKKSDMSAFDTAVRELYEETGINISDKQLGARLLRAQIVIRRPEYGIEELLVFFIIVVNIRPQVNIPLRELMGYSWVNSSEWHLMKDVSMPTRQLLIILSNVKTFDKLSNFGVNIPCIY